MANEIIHSGTAIASAMPISSPTAQSVAIVPTTVTELLAVMEAADIKGMPMMHTACGVLATYLSTTTDSLTIQAVFDAKGQFRKHLVGRKYAENSVRTYVNQAKALINAAMALGWKSTDTVPEEWKGVLSAAKSRVIRKGLVKYLAAIHQKPLDVSEEDVDCWTEMMVKNGFSLTHSFRTVGWLKRTLKTMGLAGSWVQDAPTQYQVPVEKFPSRLKSEVTALIKWKQAEFAPGRPSDGQHRAITADAFRSLLCRLYGFAINIREEVGISCLADLVREEIVTAFVEWRINERHNGTYAIRIGLGMLRAALRHHPVHGKIATEWCDTLMESIPVEPESAMRARKAEKYVDYGALEKIPELIAEDRLKHKATSLKASQLVMQELLMRWLSCLPWRQKNLREMRISGPEPNIFKDVIPPFSELKKPEWVIKEEKANPSARFWQFRFKPSETKNGHEVHSLLPKQLVPLLELYLGEHRHRMLRGHQCDTLFVNRRGGEVDSIIMLFLVRELTLRYANRQVTPHRFRDIVAYTWLDEHPEDYLRLSKLLWHRNVSTTIRIYGARFNESNGVCAMEAWLDERAAGRK